MADQRTQKTALNNASARLRDAIYNKRGYTTVKRLHAEYEGAFKAWQRTEIDATVKHYETMSATHNRATNEMREIYRAHAHRRFVQGVLVGVGIGMSVVTIVMVLS